MRLLNTATGRFVQVEDPQKVRYAILSHVWTRPDEPHYPEQTFQDVRKIQRQHGGEESVVPFFSEKVRGFCEKACADGFRLAWADTCCIDKTNDAEMAEAINSMFVWYRDASACYTILSDVDYHGGDPSGYEEALRNSNWFCRGWTLQELVAPKTVVFFSNQWQPLGSKRTLAPRTVEITGIDYDILVHVKPLNEVSASSRISWAAKRRTTRTEDEAYSLLGLLGIEMPISYGEGRVAFLRLQEKIAERTPHDASVFVWGPILHEQQLTSGSLVLSTSPPISSIPTSSQPCLLAAAPKDFLWSSRTNHFSPKVLLRSLGGEAEHIQGFTQTAFGFFARLPLLPLLSQGAHTYITLLPCNDSEERILGVLLRSSAELSQANIFYVATVAVGDLHPAHITALSKETINSFRASLRIADVYISHRLPVRSAGFLEARLHATLSHGRGSFEVRQTLWSRNALLWQGYEVSPASYVNVALPSLEFGRTLLSGAASPGVVISRSGEKISIRVGRCRCLFGSRLGLLAVSASFQDQNGTRDLLSECSECSQPHRFDHPAHISSWTFVRPVTAMKDPAVRPDTVMKDLEVDPQTTLRLTLFMESSSSRTKVLQLGAELIDLGEMPLAKETVTVGGGDGRAGLVGIAVSEGGCFRREVEY